MGPKDLKKQLIEVTEERDSLRRRLVTLALLARSVITDVDIAARSIVRLEAEVAVIEATHTNQGEV